MCLIGVPVAMSLGISALISGLHVGITPIVMCQQIYAQLDSFTLLAIPLFLLVGNIMDRGQITDRLVGFASKLVGHITGGLGHVNVVANMIMAGISGSATADAAALGRNYDPLYAQGRLYPGNGSGHQCLCRNHRPHHPAQHHDGYLRCIRQQFPLPHCSWRALSPVCWWA